MSKVAKGKEKENQHIQVYVRCRPLNSAEKKQNSYPVVEAVPERKEVIVRDRCVDKVPKTFTFDKVFDANVAQVDVYRAVVCPLLDEVLLGYNCTVFAYGQTGTGKTFTMEGERSLNSTISWEEDPLAGIIPRALHQLFHELRQQCLEYSVRISFLELYNEELFDLLSPIDDQSKLRIYEDSARKGSVIINGLEEVVVHSKDEVYAILERGSMKRQTAATLMNTNSSRSHTIFSITVHIKENSLEGEELLKTGKLNLVDLAGSENIGRSGAVDKRAREAGNINQSLLTLGRVITALVERAPHIPYRESKLTRLLQDSLGGRTKTSIIATVSPASVNAEETLSTLDYAHRAKNITNRPEVNQKLTKKTLIKEYTEEIERLRRELIATREKNGIYIDEESYNNLHAKILVQSEEIAERMNYIKILSEELEKMTRLFEMTKKELADCSAELDQTNQILNKTETDLNNTLKVLRQTATERDEQQYLVKSHLNTELLLSSQASQLLEVADKATADVGGLHEKLDRTKKTETHNEDVLRAFGWTVKQQISKMANVVSQFGQDHTNFCHMLNANFGNLLEKRVGELNTLNEQMTSFVTSQTNDCVSMDSLLLSHTKDNLKWIQDIIDSSRTFKEHQLEKHQLFERETLGPLLINVISSLRQESEFLKNTKDDFLKKIEQWKNEANIQIHEQLSVLENITIEVERLSETQNRLIQSSFDRLNLAREKEKNLQKKVNENVQSMTAMMMGLQKLIVDHSSESNAEYNSIECDLHEVLDAELSFHANVASHATNLKESLEGFQQVTSIHAESIIKTCNEYEDKASQVNKEATKAQLQLQQQAIQFNQMAQMAWEENFQSLETAAQLRREVINANLQSQHAHTEMILSSMKNSVITQESLIEQQQLEFNGYISSQQEQLVNQCPLITEWTTSVTKQAYEIDSEVEHLLEHEFRKSVPTGLTPQRNEFSYPRDLVATSPHDRILQRLRSRLDTQLASQIPLPDFETEDSHTTESQESLFSGNFKEKDETQTSNNHCNTSSSFKCDISSISDSSDKMDNEVKENGIIVTTNRTSTKKKLKKNSKNIRRPLQSQNNGDV